MVKPRFLGYCFNQRQHHAGFDGGFTYFASEAVSWASSSRNWHALCEELRQRQMACDVSVSPGYDDEKIRPWNSANTVPRSRERFIHLIDTALEASPSSISITSWNEWGEGTQVEECEDREGYAKCEDMLTVVGNIKQTKWEEDEL